MPPLRESGEVVRLLAKRLRLGAFSRAPFRPVRFETKADEAQCDWFVRSADPWDSDLRSDIRERNESAQALLDALAVRDVIFEVMPTARSAFLRGFRQPAREPPELIIAGTVDREGTVARVDSVAMQAKLLGLCFRLEEGVLRSLESNQSLNRLTLTRRPLWVEEEYRNGSK